jgi:hypothetical protein
MQATEARIRANQQNAALSTGPRTEAGKERSRQNSLKHGLTGNGVVLPQADAAEVERRTASYADELGAVGDVGHALARFAALNAVRAERAADQQTAALTARIRQVEANFVPPEGVDDDEAALLRDEAVRIAMHDASPEAVLIRKYEVAAERGFYKAINKLRQLEREAEALLKAEDTDRVNAMMASFLKNQEAARRMDEEMDARYPELAMPTPTCMANTTQLTQMGGEVDVPITIGRSR